MACRSCCFFRRPPSTERRNCGLWFGLVVGSSGRQGAPRFGAVEEKTMRTFEFRVYKLRTKEALEFYIGEIIPSSQELSAIRD